MNRVRGPWDAPGSLPDTPALAAATTDRDVSQYPCSSCGAILSYRPGQRTLHCDFCGSDTPIPQADPQRLRAAVRELDFRSALEGLAGGAATEVTQIVRCDSCGAEVEFDPNNHARECPFCATPLVADPTPDRHIRPQALLPFAIGASEARDRIARWLGSRWFAPNGLKTFARTSSKLTGIYTPYWTFDARTETIYAGRRGDPYTVTVRGPKGEPRVETRIRWTPVQGRTARDFDDVLVLGSTSLPEAETEALNPWDLNSLEPYARDYLAGFRAETYTVPLDQAWVRARRKMEAVIAQDVRMAIGGAQQQVTRSDTRMGGVTFKHVLLPVWVAAYRYRGRLWQVVINGRTGEVQGERPYSVWKIALAVLAALVLLGATFAVMQAGQPQ